MPVGGDRDHGAGQQPKRHEWKAKQQRAVADLVNYFQGWEERNEAGGFLGLQATFLQEIKQAGTEADKQRGVSDENQKDVGSQPSFVGHVLGEQHGLFVNSGHEGQKKHHGKNDHARRCGLVNRIDEHEEAHGEESQQRLSVVHRRPDDMAGKEKFGQRDEVENHAQAGRMEGDTAEQVAGARERHEGVDQADEVTTQREAQPKQRHRPLTVSQSPEFTLISQSYAPGRPISHSVAH